MRDCQFVDLNAIMDEGRQVTVLWQEDESLAFAHGSGVVCTDEYFLHPDPYPTREDWCWARVEHTRKLLDSGHVKGRVIRLSSALVGVGIPLHPGSEKFYKERGMIK